MFAGKKKKKKMRDRKGETAVSFPLGKELRSVLSKADTQGHFLITLLPCACLPAPRHHVSTAPPPHRDMNLPQNTAVIKTQGVSSTGVRI